MAILPNFLSLLSPIPQQDNCADANVDVNIVVRSNELQQNKIGELFKYQKVGSVEQARFLYAGTR